MSSVKLEAAPDRDQVPIETLAIVVHRAEAVILLQSSGDKEALKPTPTSSLVAASFSRDNQRALL